MEIRPQISVKNKRTGERQLYRIDQERITAGRDHANYVVLDGRTVSRKHVEILHEGSQFFVRDLKSNNGTNLNEKPLTPNEKALLRSGDLIQVEDFDLQFLIPTTDEAEEIYEITDTDLLEVKMVKKLLKAMDRENAPSLEVIEGPQAGLLFALEEKNQDVVIGRDPACEFVIDSNVISRKHARIEKRFDTAILHDLDSKNGTFVNREKVKEKRLQDGDIIHLGTLAISFKNPQDLSFDFEPPQIQKAKRPETSAPPGTPKIAQVEEILDEEPAEDRGAEASPMGTRSSRRKGGAKRKPSKTRPSPPGQSPENLPGEMPAEGGFEEFPPQEGEQALAENEGGVGLKVGGFRFSVMEILAALVGLVVLVGSIWAILKIL
jgi:pSer/pThr/pTyr-binding forkhead associated (FHA) protein